MNEYENDLSMESIDRAARQVENSAPILATTSLDRSPEDGVRALTIGRGLGVNPAAVLDDLDGYDNDLRLNLTDSIVRQNRHIAAYLNSDPMAAIVSNDDYGNMHNFSQSVPGFQFFDKLFE
jgi:hypothetical protein